MKRFKVILVTLAAIMFAGTVAAQTTAADIATKYNEAADMVNAKKYAEAITALQSVIDKGLDIPEALENVEAAQKLLPTCYYMNGMSFAQAGKLEDAATQLTKAVETAELYGNMDISTKAKPRLSQVYGVLAGQAFNNKDYAKAISIYSEAFEANNKDTKTALNLAMAYCENNELDKGLDVYSKIIELGPTHSKYAEDAATAKEKAAYYIMLKAAEAAQAKENDKVFELCDKALTFDPANPEANMMRVQTATNMKDYAKVISYGEAPAEAQTTPELKSDAYFLLGAAYQNTENKAKAIETYRKVVAGANVANAKAQITALSK